MSVPSTNPLVNPPDTACLKLSRTIGIGSPSECVKSFAAVKDTVLDHGGPRYGRSSDRYRPPTALFNHALAGLQYDLEHLEALTPLKTTIPYPFDLISRSGNFFFTRRIEGRRISGTSSKPFSYERASGMNRWLVEGSYWAGFGSKGALCI